MTDPAVTPAKPIVLLVTTVHGFKYRVEVPPSIVGSIEQLVVAMTNPARPYVLFGKPARAKGADDEYIMPWNIGTMRQWQTSDGE